MYLALREIRHAKLRFGLITGVIVMVSSLVFILSGLANGLATGNSAAIDALPVDAIVVSAGSDYQLDRSSVPVNTAEVIREQPGIEDVTPFGASATNVKRQGSDDVLGISLIGVAPESFAAPEPREGDPVGSGDNGVIIDQTLVNEGVSIGDTLVTEPGGVELLVVGAVSDQSYRLAPTMFAPIEVWQETQAQASGGDDTAVSAMLVRGDFGAIAALPDVVGSAMVASKSQIVENMPGYSEQAVTLLLIQVFLVVIAAGIVASFFYIITLQKMPELGVMKAIGTTTAYIARTLVLQVVLLGLVGVIVGTAIACIVSVAIGSAVPFDLSVPQFFVFGGILLVVAILGTVLSLVRVARVDPLDAISKAG
jgi:putative ABC transport system permease protein